MTFPYHITSHLCVVSRPSAGKVVRNNEAFFLPEVIPAHYHQRREDMEAKKQVRRTERGHYYTPARGTIENCVAPQGSPSRKGSYSVSPRQKHCLPSNSPRNLLSELVSGLKCIPCTYLSNELHRRSYQATLQESWSHQ